MATPKKEELKARFSAAEKKAIEEVFKQFPLIGGKSNIVRLSIKFTIKKIKAGENPLEALTEAQTK